MKMGNWEWGIIVCLKGNLIRQPFGLTDEVPRPQPRLRTKFNSSFLIPNS